jgi:hypothetical protein
VCYARSLKNTERRRIGLSRAALRPGIARDHEAIARHIEQVEIGVQLRPLQFVDLRINQHPARFLGIPVFADPMVLETTGIEIGAEPATRPGRNTLGAQQGDEQDGEVTADTDEARIDRSTDGKRLGVMGEEASKHPLCGTEMGLAPAPVRKRYDISGCPMLMQQQALHNAGESSHIARQLIEHGRVSATARHLRRTCIEVENLLYRHD